MNLKEKLWEIELAIQEENFAKALNFYHEIKENWKFYEEFLRKHPEDLEKILNLITYLSKLLEERMKNLKIQAKFLKIRKSYTQY